jgi:hypothetical protein
MRVVRNNVFETNSSSTHAISLKKTSRKNNQTGVLVGSKTYKYKSYGVKKEELWSYRYNTSLYTGYEKLCACFDLLYLDSCGVSKKKLRDMDMAKCGEFLENYRKYPEDDFIILMDRFKLSEFFKSQNYKTLLKVLKRHNIVFEIDTDYFLTNPGDKYPIHCDSYRYDSPFNLMEYLRHIGFLREYKLKSLEEVLEFILFTPDIYMYYLFMQN